MTPPDLLPTGVLSAVADPRHFDGPWLPAEEAVVARAVPKRRREFGCGRHLARGLLKRLDQPTGALLPRPDRRLPWPFEVVGSISHCEDRCWVVAALRRDWTTVGVDVEDAAPLSQDTLQIVTTSEERARFTPEAAPGEWGKAIFVAKEAYYKAQYELTQRFLEFTDVEVRFEASPRPGRWVGYEAGGASSPTLSGRMLKDGEHLWAFSGRQR